jgi:hypothetical protein
MREFQSHPSKETVELDRRAPLKGRDIGNPFRIRLDSLCFRSIQVDHNPADR